jgi:hypothetical protein
MTRKINVEYSGIEFTVKGNYEKGYSATQLDPGQSDGFDDYAIFLGDIDLTDLLAEGVVDSILEDAVQSIKDESDPRYKD